MPRYTIEFDLSKQGTNVWPFRMYRCKKTLHWPKQLERHNHIYEDLSTRGEARIISFSCRRRSAIAKRNTSLEVHKEREHPHKKKTHPQVPQLPRTSRNQHHNLSHAIPHRSRVRNLAQIPEIRFPLPLILLLPPDILKFDVQLSNLGRDIRDVRTVVVEVRAGFTDRDVEVHSDMGRS